MAALLKRMGYAVALLMCPGHAAVGVAGAEALPGTYVTDPTAGIRHFCAETTADGWLLGESPKYLEPYLPRGNLRSCRWWYECPAETLWSRLRAS